MKLIDSVKRFCRKGNTPAIVYLARSHPQNSERIARLQALGASYQVKYIA